MNAPAVVLADEPTGNLDSKNSQEIITLLKESNKKYNQTLILITHDENIALQANRIISIEDGKITNLFEKPDQVANDLLGCGTFLFKPDLFEAIERTEISARTGRKELADAVNTLIRSGGRVLPFFLTGGYVNVNTSDDLSQARHMVRAAHFDEKTGIATYRGSVVIRQGTLELRSDELVINVDKQGNVTKTSARGKPARYQQQVDPKKGLVSAEATRIDYDLKNEVITLNGQARLRQDGASFQGATITYAIARQQVDAKGDASNRVQLVLPPQPRAPRKDARP